MKAITLHQPWAHAVLALGKDVENRSWTTRYRGLLLIHAGVVVERGEARQLGLDPATLTTGAVVGVVTLAGIERDVSSTWALPGHWHWQLRDPIAIEPVACRGRQTLFQPPPEVIEAVRAQLDVTP
jgi:hypothetical protein